MQVKYIAFYIKLISRETMTNKFYSLMILFLIHINKNILFSENTFGVHKNKID